MARGERRQRFGIRLMISVMAMLVAVGTAQYVLATRALTSRVLQQSTRAHESDAAVLQGLYRSDPDDRWSKVQELVDHVRSRPGSSAVAVIGPDGVVEVVGRGHHAADEDAAPAHGEPMADAADDHSGGMPMPVAADDDMAMPAATDDDMASMGDSPHGLHVGSPVDELYRPLVDEVLLSGRPHAGKEPHRPGRELVFFVPIELGGERHVFEVAKDSAILDEQVTDVRRVLIATLGLGLPFGLLLFYGIGGRALTARHRMAERRSSRDHLTGLGNHRSFQEELRREVGLGRRHGEPLTLALIDIDDFKLVNDVHGHRRGDAVLAQIGNVLQTGRPEDRAYRVGGDEFAMLLHQTDLEGARVLAEQIRMKVVGLGLGVTTSIGLAQLGHPAPDADDLFETADAALYQAKAGGRNRVAWHDHRPADDDYPATAGGSERAGSEHQGAH